MDKYMDKIEKTTEQGDKINDKGRDIANKFESIGRLIDKLKQRSVQDDATRRYIRMLERQYDKIFNDTYKEQVEKPFESIKNSLKDTQEKIENEHKKLKVTIGDVREMQTNSDIGKYEAKKTEYLMQKKACEYEAKKNRINDIVAKQDSVARDSKHRINKRLLAGIAASTAFVSGAVSQLFVRDQSMNEHDIISANAITKVVEISKNVHDMSECIVDIPKRKRKAKKILEENNTLYELDYGEFRDTEV